MVKFQDALAYPPRMMNADRSAAYVDLSKTKFLEGVDSGTWPAAKDVDGMPRWDRLELDAAVGTLGTRSSHGDKIEAGVVFRVSASR
jgi:hypothetical protein